MSQLVLSLFPGGGMLDHAFELEGFTVVRGPDVIWGGDIRRFHPPAGRFDGIIGGDPCQSHSALANLVRAKGLEPSFPDMTPEYQRVVEEAQPAWFLRENVPQAPDIKPAGYDVRTFKLCNSTLDSGDGTGNEQMRKRRWWFGVREGECPELRQWIEFALFELPDTETAVGGHDGTADAINGYRKARKAAPVTGRHEGAVGALGVDYSPPRRTLEEMCRLQGLPEDWLKHQPWTMAAKRKIIGNGVAVPMGRAIAKAVRRATE
jgi:DNA (cytosine-5)-methyltransferase 1